MKNLLLYEYGMMSSRWLVASGCMTLLLVGCGEPKSQTQIAREVQKSIVLIDYEDRSGHGTGFVVPGAKDVCTVMTAGQVVKGSSKLQLQTPDGKVWQAGQIKRFPDQDMAVVTFVPQGKSCPYPPVQLGNSNRVQRGESIYITGFTERTGGVVFVPGDVISNRKKPGWRGSGISYQSAAAEAMMGGPVLDAAGRAIAVHNSNLLPEGKEGENLAQRDLKWGVPVNGYGVKPVAISPAFVESPVKLPGSKAELVAGLVAGALLSLGGLVSYGVSRGKEPEAKGKLERGNRMFDEGRYADAVICYNQAIAAAPESAEAWNNRGLALENMQRKAEGLSSYDRALNLKPDYQQAWYNRGVALRKLERYAEAVSSYDRAVEIKSDYHQAWNNRGVALGRWERYEEALASLDRAIELKVDYHEAWNNRGVTLDKKQRYEEALKCYDRALAIKEDFPVAWNNRGLALFKLKRPAEAVLECFDRAIELKRDYYEAWYNRGLVLYYYQRYAEAVESFDAAVEYKRDYYEAWYHRGLALGKLHRYLQEVSSYDRAVEYKPDYHQAWYNRGVAQGKLHRYEEAIGSYDRTIALQPENYTAWNNRGEMLLALGRYEEALSSGDRAVAIKPDYEEGWNNVRFV